ncbi:MAG: hypothetical protein ACI9VR_001848 [Cognaticolwellia sp.]|jgi:hypothetical protein
MASPRLLVLVQDPRDRLSVITQLRHRFEVLSPVSSPPTVRAVRETRAELVLIGLHPRSVSPSLRLCLAIKTDRKAPRVVVWDPGGASDPQSAIETHLADAYVRGQAPPKEFAQWLESFTTGDTLEGPVKLGLFRRIFSPKN